MTTNTLFTRSGLPQSGLIRSLTALCALIAVISGCAHAKTPGEQFRQIMADIDKQCRKEQRGPYETQPPSNGIRYTDCDILLLKPQDPLATPEGRFAHAIQLPAPYDKPKDVYKPGMKSVEYFKALCDAEAGDFVFKTVEGVDGVLQMRPYQAEPELKGQFFAYEGIVGNGVAMSANAEGYLVGDRRIYYDFFESPVRAASKDFVYQHWFPVVDEDELRRKRSSRSDVGLSHKMVIQQAPIARYGYTQRGIKRMNDLEYGIRGAELIVLDLQSNATLGFRRVFRRYYFDNSEIPGQVFSDYCPKGSDGFKFINKVLIPKMMQREARMP